MKQSRNEITAPMVRPLRERVAIRRGRETSAPGVTARLFTRRVKSFPVWSGLARYGRRSDKVLLQNQETVARGHTSLDWRWSVFPQRRRGSRLVALSARLISSPPMCANCGVVAWCVRVTVGQTWSQSSTCTSGDG